MKHFPDCYQSAGKYSFTLVWGFCDDCFTSGTTAWKTRLWHILELVCRLWRPDSLLQFLIGQRLNQAANRKPVFVVFLQIWFVAGVWGPEPSKCWFWTKLTRCLTKVRLSMCKRITWTQTQPHKAVKSQFSVSAQVNWALSFTWWSFSYVCMKKVF